MNSIYEQYSKERKELQEHGDIPQFYTTGGYQMAMLKYVQTGKTLKERYETIAKTAARIADDLYGKNNWYDKFFEAIWNGWLSPSTPVLANLGTDRGLSVACTGNYVEDSIYGFYSSRLESAVLTKHGFGTSSYLGDIRPRGSKFSDNGKANGVIPVIKGFVQDMDDTSQGSTRRGAWAGYLEADHDDFEEVIQYLGNSPDGLNIGWNITDNFIERLISGDKEAIGRWQKILKTRVITGKGYLHFVDKANKLAPNKYKELGLKIKASNLCSEIELISDDNNSFSCVLSSLNISKYDEWKDTDLVFNATVFLDCIAEDLIRRGSKIPGMERVISFTKNSRALGLGAMGYHTYLQGKMIPFDSQEAEQININIFSNIQNSAEQASVWMAQKQDSPVWADDHRRNSTLLAIAPTMSTALLVGGISQGIEPIVANVFNQSTSAGEMARINPQLVNIMKERNVYNQKTIDFIIDDNGSVRNVDWLSEHEKEVFKTAYEINQKAIIKQASNRQKYIDQGQSINLFFDANESPQYINEIHKEAMLDPYIKSLYYVRSKAGIQASKKQRKGDV